MTLLQETDSLKKTPLYERHLALQAKIVDFNGWAMPVYYTGILQEHQWTRQSCGVFDVSHLGEIRVKGEGAFQFLQHRLTNDMNKLKDNKILYSLLCDERGMTLDDILIYQAKRDDYYLIVNARNIQKDLETLRKYAPESVTITDQSDTMTCLAIQGPKSETILERLFGFRLHELGYYFFKEEKFKQEPVWVSRSGYTGEDGFEIFSPNALSVPLWDRILNDGKKEGVLPAGLGARNTLRLEAGNALYGHDLDETTTPLEAGLQGVVSFTKGGFVGRDRLWKEKQEGPKRRLVGFKVKDKPIAREHYPIFSGSKKIGEVTSGSFGPTVGYNIGLGYVAAGFEASGTLIEIEIHGRRVSAEVVRRPFIKLKHKKG